MNTPRRRGPRTLALALVIAAGLWSRSGAAWLPALLVTHAGDALYAVAAHLVLGILAPRLSGRALFAWSLGFCLCVEASQSVDWPWLGALRELPGGRLVLGYGFDPSDPWRYLAGTVAAAFLDRKLPRTRLPSRAGTNYDGRTMNQRATVVVYRTRTCPFCTAAEDLLKARGIAFDEVYLDDSPNRRAATAAILPGHTTVPLILIDDDPIGGFDALRALDRSGSLSSRVFTAD